jgi:hypothetical protein
MTTSCQKAHSALFSRKTLATHPGVDVSVGVVHYVVAKVVVRLNFALSIYIATVKHQVKNSKQRWNTTRLRTSVELANATGQEV